MLGRLFGRGSSKSKEADDAATAGPAPPPPPPQPSWRRVTAVTACSLPVGEGGSSTSFVAVAEAPSHRVILHAIPGAAAAAAAAAAAGAVAVHPSPPPSSVDLTATILGNSPQRLPCRGCTPHARGRQQQKPCPFCWTALAFAGGTAKSGLLVLVSPASFAILDVARSRAVMVCGAVSSVEAGEFEPTRFFTGLACPPALRYVIVGTQVRGSGNDDDDDTSLPPSAVVDEAVATRVVELMADEVDRPVSMAMPSLSAAAADDDDDDDDENGDENDASTAPTMAVWEARWVRRHTVRMDRDTRARRCFVSRRRSSIDQLVTWPRDHSIAFSLVTDDDDDASGAYEHNKRMVVVASSVVVGGCITAEFQLPGTGAMGRRTDLLLSAGTDAVILAYREEQIGANVVVGWDLSSASHASVAGDLAAQYFVKNRADRSTKRTCVVEVRPPSWSMSVDLSSVALRVQVPRRRRCCRGPPERQPSPPIPPAAAAAASPSSYDAVDCAAGSGGPVEGVVVEGTVVVGAEDVVPVDGGAADGGQPPLAEKQSAPLTPPRSPVRPTPVEFDEQVARDWRLAALLPIVATSTTPDGSAAAGLNALLVSSVPSYVPSEDGDSAAATGSSQARPRQFAAVVVSVERPGRVVAIDETLSVASALADEGDDEGGGGAVISADRAECHVVQDATDDVAGTTWWWCSAQAEQEGGGGGTPHAPVARVRQGAPHLEWAVPTALPRRPPAEVADGNGDAASSRRRRGRIAELLRAKPIPRPHEEPSVALLAAIHPVLHRVWGPLPRLAISSQDVEKGIKASRGVGAAFGRVFGGDKKKTSSAAKDAPATYIEANHTVLTEHAGRIAATLALVESSLPEHDGNDEPNAAAAAVPPVQATMSAATTGPPTAAPPAADVGESAAPAARGGFKIPPSRHTERKGGPGKEEDFDTWVAKTVAPTLPSAGARAKLVAGTTARDTEPESRLDQYRRNKALKAEMNETKNAMNEAQERLQERGERIDELGERTAEMDQHAGDFAAAAAAYRKQQQNKKWWQL